MGYPKENPEYLGILAAVNESLNKPVMAAIIAKKLGIRKQYVNNLLRLAAKKHPDTEILAAASRSPKIYVFKTKVTLKDLHPLVKGNPVLNRKTRAAMESPAVGANYDMLRQIQNRMGDFDSHQTKSLQEIANMADRLYAMTVAIEELTKTVDALKKLWEVPDGKAA